MNKLCTFVGSAAFAAAILLLAGRTAKASGQTGALVRLQPNSPGAAQSGHANINGTFRAGKVSAQNTGTAGEFVGSSSTSTALFAHATAASGSTFAGYFRTESTDGTGLVVDSFGPAAIIGRAQKSSGSSIGGEFTATSLDGLALFAYSAGNTTARIQNNSIGKALDVYSNGNAGITVVCGSSVGSSVVGHFQSNTSSSSTALYGRTVATDSSVAPYGVVGETSTATLGLAVLALGDMSATGFKPFRIDHPGDPENKYLFHYASESPFPQNFYSGNVVTDGKGYAWVELPSYFKEINANFKYQLTVISEDFVQAVVSRKIEGNRFQVRTSAPRTEVSWRVEADRNDERTRFRAPQDEVEKPASERGTLQHPEYYGLPKERSLSYRLRSASSQK